MYVTSELFWKLCQKVVIPLYFMCHAKQATVCLTDSRKEFEGKDSN